MNIPVFNCHHLRDITVRDFITNQPLVRYENVAEIDKNLCYYPLKDNEEIIRFTDNTRYLFKKGISKRIILH